jgi:4-alpha-glucanotransferase
MRIKPCEKHCATCAKVLIQSINEPANPKHYWRYRMHLSLETLIASKSFNEDWAMAIKESGR